MNTPKHRKPSHILPDDGRWCCDVHGVAYNKLLDRDPNTITAGEIHWLVTDQTIGLLTAASFHYFFPVIARHAASLREDPYAAEQLMQLALRMGDWTDEERRTIVRLVHEMVHGRTAPITVRLLGPGPGDPFQYHRDWRSFQGGEPYPKTIFFLEAVDEDVPAVQQLLVSAAPPVRRSVTEHYYFHVLYGWRVHHQAYDPFYRQAHLTAYLRANADLAQDPALSLLSLLILKTIAPAVFREQYPTLRGPLTAQHQALLTQRRHLGDRPAPMYLRAAILFFEEGLEKLAGST
ncbi:MAG: hypothetical protein HY597_04415 [Candidatus Omnitrophica bacterium]|nr:hypothetical protein [Candidatus Omnitrophota bacterium]